MTNLATKEIKFYEDTLLGVKTEDGQIYLAVKRTALNIGLSEDQAKSEVKKIQELDLFKSNWVKFNTVQNEGGRQVSREIVCLLEKFVPMWLAQINITPKMKLQNPIAAEKLLTYQKECVDILHQAFMSNEESRKDFYDRFDLKCELQDILSSEINKAVEPLNKQIIDLTKQIGTSNEYSEQLQNKIIKLEDTIENINSKFKIPYNKSALFEKLKIDFLSAINYYDTTSYTTFYNHLQNWLGYRFPYSTNTKQWIIGGVI